jgi:serine/threonine-protein phosphatase 2A regulatory subunit B''
VLVDQRTLLVSIKRVFLMKIFLVGQLPLRSLVFRPFSTSQQVKEDDMSADQSKPLLLAQKLAAFNAKHGKYRTPQELCAAEEKQCAEESLILAAQIQQARNASSPCGSPVTPTFYLRAANPNAHSIVEKISNAATTMELDLRASQIEEFDDQAHKKVLDLLTANGVRKTISLDDYMRVVDAFRKWRNERIETGLPSQESAPAGVPRHEHIPSATPLNQIRFLPCTLPELNLEMFITCPRELSGLVDVQLLFQKFSKQVARLKCEAELLMFDNDGDGRLTEEDLDSYIRYLIPSITSIGSIPQDSIPFYSCAVSRRLFWALDISNRGSIRIADLIHSDVMDEWLDLQLAREDPPRNWFSNTVTTQLYEKFLLLDSNESGMLTAANMKRYKKGIPTVVDDGLPRDISPLSSLFIDRVFEISALYKSEMDYKSFVDFVIAVEFLPQCSRPRYFWSIFDLEGTGVLTPMNVLHFFRETYQKLVDAGVEAPPLELVIQELFDIVPTKEPLRITRQEFLAAPQSAGLLSALMIDCLAFWTYENRDHK